MYSQLNISEANQLRSSQSPESVANRLYDKAKRRGMLDSLKKLFGKKGTVHLFTLEEVLRQVQIQSQKAIGVKQVDINQIMGTIAGGRGRDFDIDFRPLQQHNKERWLGVATAWLSGRRLGRVKLVQVGNIFFVKDGHHRISVAKAMGEQEVEAEVVMLLGKGTVSVSALLEEVKATGRPALQPAAV